MKQGFIILCLLLSCSYSAFAQKSVDIIVKAIEQSDANKIAEHFDKIIDITINKDQSTYSKSQGKVVLNNFFSNNPSKSFSIKHKGHPADFSSIYLIGDLQTKNGNAYRVYLYFKDKSGVMVLQGIRIEQ